MDDIGRLATAFFRDPRIQVVVWLIVVHTLMRIAVAVKDWTFDLRKVGDFYRKRVVPLTIGGLALYLASRNIPAEVVGLYADAVGEVAFTGAWLLLVGAIVGDLVDAGKAIGYTFFGAATPNTRDKLLAEKERRVGEINALLSRRGSNNG